MNKKVFIFWAILIFVASWRFAFSFQTDKPDIGFCLKQEVRGNGRITEDPVSNDSGQILVVSADSLFTNSTSTDTACNTDILIRMKTKLYPKFHFGQNISFVGKLSQPINFKSSSGRAFDFVDYLAKDDIYYEIKSAMVNRTIEQSKDSSFGFGQIIDQVTSILYKIKRGFVNNLNNALGEPHSALAAGLVVGEKSALGKDLLNDFRIVGLIHVVVLSGFNITIVADALRRLLSRLPRMWGILIGGVGMILFGILVGGGATVVRSCFMASVALFADVIRRDYSVLRALMFAGLIMLIQNPKILLYDPSFQLSFLATLGLILLAKPIEDKISFIPDKFGLRDTVASTFATQIFVSPFILYMMGQISLIGVVVNILVLPFIPATMLFVFLTGATGFISIYISQVFGWISHFLLSYELLMVQNFARIPFAALYTPQFSIWWVVIFYVVFLSGYAYFLRKS